MIRLNHVSKIYGDGSKKAVDDLSWDIEDGKITGFIGPNGAGKTTTLKMITGILAPSEGTIEINGKDIQKDPLVRGARVKAGQRLIENPDRRLVDQCAHHHDFLTHAMRVAHDTARKVLDEPLTGLDPRSAHELKQMMREHADAGNAVLFSTHVLEVAEKLCDRIAIIHHGRQVYLGSLEELKAAYPDQTLENIFLEITEHA